MHLTVLIVEDHPETREGYAEVLSDAGFSTVEATTAEHALRRAGALAPAVIVSDLRLGSGASGLDLCEQLKRDPSTSHIPMIVITGWSAEDGLHARARAAGCPTVLQKPVSPGELVAAVTNALKAA